MKLNGKNEMEMPPPALHAPAEAFTYHLYLTPQKHRILQLHPVVDYRRGSVTYGER